MVGMMKRILLVGWLLVLFTEVDVFGQCTNNNTFLMNFTPTCTGVQQQVTNCIMGGQYVAVAVVAGNSYNFNTCGNGAFDTQITLFNSTGGLNVGYNDDGCVGTFQSTINWTATFTGTLWVLVDAYPCSNNTTCIPLNMTCTPAPTPSSACVSPIPDICSMACDLGTLPTPPTCTGGATVTNGNPLLFALSNVGAIAENPYSTVAGCANPGTDVWYRFRATGTQLVLNIASGANALNNPNVSLYNGNNCNALLPLACFTGGGGSLNQTYSPITPGDYYYLQISGGNAADVCDFTLTIRNNYDCDNCFLAGDLQVTPAPVNGTYGAGQTVQFCFTVSNYNQTAANWLHGIDLNFGPGWDVSTLSATTIPASCATTAGAHWGFYNSVTGGYSGVTYGPGFWYETSSGGPLDGNPGNNFGDVGVGVNCPRTFCWQITTKPVGQCTSGASLNVAINTLGDSESGSWGSTGCTNDPITNFLATLACCAQPIITVTNTTCGQSNGKIRAQGQGSAPWRYQWANAGGTIIANHTNVNGADSIMNLAAGNYNLTVTDNLGCSVATSITVNASSGGTTTASNTGPYCANQTISLATTGVGTGYSWNGPGGYTSAVQNPTRNTATTAMAGVYTVTVTFAAGCTATASTTVVVNPLPTAAIAPVNPTICNGTSTTLNATGGTSYTWSNSGSTPAITVSPTTNTTYNVTVTDANTCTASATTTVTVVPTMNLSIVPTHVACNGGNTGSIDLTVTSGGQAPFNYLWNGGAVTEDRTNIPAGTYTVTVTDNALCTATTSVTVTQPAVLIVTETHVDVFCAGGNNGSINLTATGGTIPYVYAWNGGGNTPNRTGLVAGNYSVTVTDAHACTFSLAVTIADGGTVSLSETHVNVNCNGGSTGSIDLTATGGQTPYTYAWNGGAATEDQTNITAGTYSVTVNDSHSCSATLTVTITQPPVLTASTTHTDRSEERRVGKECRSRWSPYP